jgi:uncharacterized protein (TIGR00369 family)
VRLEAAALPRGAVLPIEFDGGDYVVWRGEGGVLGSAPRSCPHLDHDLAEGYVVGDELVCPGHAWAFDGRGHAYKRNEFGRVDPKGMVAALRLEERDGGIDVYGRPLMPTTYPPERHLLRDLRLTFEHGAGAGRDRTSRAWMPVVPELSAADGAVRAGALATLVDVIGGGLAATVAQPDWIATADLTLHVFGAATDGAVEARARVAHAGRTTIVIEVELYDESGGEIGIATMSFAVLPRRDDNPDVSASTTTSGSSTMALAGSRLQTSLLDELEVRVIDAALGELEAPIGEWSRNSLGAMQGGAVATIVDAAAEAAATAASGEPLVVTDIQLTYLALARVGPLRTHTEVLGNTPGAVTMRVELIDTGAGSRVTSVARVVATSSLRETA